MLVLSRKPNEAIVVGGDIRVIVLQIRGNSVQLGIEAPLTVPVHRAEVHQRIFDEQMSAEQVALN